MKIQILIKKFKSWTLIKFPSENLCHWFPIHSFNTTSNICIQFCKSTSELHPVIKSIFGCLLLIQIKLFYLIFGHRCCARVAKLNSISFQQKILCLPFTLLFHESLRRVQTNIARVNSIKMIKCNSQRAHVVREK